MVVGELSEVQQDVGEIRILSLEGLGASYMMKGYFKLRIGGSFKRINFRGVAFGGHYGGHNVSIEISRNITRKLQSEGQFREKRALDELLSEVQRRILTGDMTVDYDKLKQGANIDPFGNASP